MDTRTGATLKLIVPLAITGIVAAACGSSGSGNAAGGSTKTSPTTTAPAAPNHGAITVDAHHGSAGMFLTDSHGRSLYLFTSDTAHRSSCTGSCLSVWPPLTTTTTAVHAGTGVSSSAISTISAGGKRQVEYHGHPLYLYIGDHSAGQTNGQGSQDFGASWWLVSPSGAELTGRSGSGAPSSHAGSGGGGYGGGYGG